MAAATNNDSFCMWNSKQVLKSGLFHSIRLVTVSGHSCEGEFKDSIQIQFKYLVKSGESVSEGFYVEYCNNIQELYKTLSIMLDISASNVQEKANLYKEAKVSLAEWVDENKHTPNINLTHWMFTVIGK